MKRVLAILLIAGLLLVGPVLAVPALADGVRPCEYVQVGTIWVRQCSPFTFTSVHCFIYTESGGGLPDVVVQACYPTQI